MTSYYVDATLGDDDAAGTEVAPWKTVARAIDYGTYGTKLNPDDQVLLKRGERWYENFTYANYPGSAGHPIVFDAYGTGAKPIIDAAVDLSSSSCWVDQGSNIWKATDDPQRGTRLLYDIGNIIFNSETSIGQKQFCQTVSGTAVAAGDLGDGNGDYIQLDASAKNTNEVYKNSTITITGGTGAGQSRTIWKYQGATRNAWVTPDWSTVPSTDSTYTVNCLDHQGDFYYYPDIAGDGAAAYLVMYSVGNPGTFYSKIECCQKTSRLSGVTGTYIDDSHDLTFRNIQWLHNSEHMMAISRCTNILVEYCDFDWAGGSYDNFTSAERDGNCVILWKNGTNIIFRYNTLSNVWETGFSVQTDTAVEVNGLYVYGNIFKNCQCGFDCWTRVEGSSHSDIKIAHNVVYNCGGGLLYPQWDNSKYPKGFRIYSGYGATDCYVVNNIIHTVQNGTENFFAFSETPSGQGWTIDYNCYYPNATANNRFAYTYSNLYTFANWQSITGFDTHSVITDPSFVALDSDWRLGNGSPCVDAGMVLSDVGQVVVGDAPDIGAYEQPLPEVDSVKLCPFRKAV